MGRKIRFVHSRSIELAVQHWPEWLDSIEKARRKFGWKAWDSNQRRKLWMEQLDEDETWTTALATVKQLRLPTIWAGYWIACLVSEYEADDPTTYCQIRCPDWAIAKVNELLGRDQMDEVLIKNTIVQSGPSARQAEHSVPPLCIETQLNQPPDSISLKIPLYLIPGLIQDLSPVAVLLENLYRCDHDIHHPLAAQLQRVGKAPQGEWARRMISNTKKDRLRDLYEYLLDSEYTLEMDKEITERLDLRKATSADGGPVSLSRHEVLDLVKKKKPTVKARVRKRVNNWFKDADAWPIPVD